MRSSRIGRTFAGFICPRRILKLPGMDDSFLMRPGSFAPLSRPYDAMSWAVSRISTQPSFRAFCTSLIICSGS